MGFNLCPVLLLCVVVGPLVFSALQKNLLPVCLQLAQGLKMPKNERQKSFFLNKS